ncbi:hypothetical protein ACTPEF_25170, partial [Clostridioides difficile]
KTYFLVSLLYISVAATSRPNITSSPGLYPAFVIASTINSKASHVYPVRYLDMAISQDVDLIVSTVELKGYEKPVLYIENIFDDSL